MYSSANTSISVPAIPLIDALENIDGIKLDIEGSEAEVLNSISDWKNVRKLVFEYHFGRLPKMDTYRQLIKNLSRTFYVKSPTYPEAWTEMTSKRAILVFGWR